METKRFLQFRSEVIEMSRKRSLSSPASRAAHWREMADTVKYVVERFVLLTVLVAGAIAVIESHLRLH